MGRPILSICIATYQRYEVLKELLEEILSVHSDEFEVIVCDDHSTDGSYENIKDLEDKRLKFYSNESNVGSIENVCKLLNYGNGVYLLYLNDRDNIDPLKLPKLLSILRFFDKNKVAFARCMSIIDAKKDFTIFASGRESFVEFSCRPHHISGFIFHKDKWESIKNRAVFFKEQKYGDWPYTYLYALLSIHNSGAYIWNDICNIDRERIDFTKVRSGFYLKRKDKRIWFMPAVQCRELCHAYKFLCRLSVPQDWIRDVICNRYDEALRNVMIHYSLFVSLPVNTVHYGLKISENKLKNHTKEILNGLFLWKHAYFFFRKYDSDIVAKINKITFSIVKEYSDIVYQDWLKYIFSSQTKSKKSE